MLLYEGALEALFLFQAIKYQKEKMATVETVALLIEWTVYMRKTELTFLCPPDKCQQ